jgi:hypothetical protein
MHPQRVTPHKVEVETLLDSHRGCAKDKASFVGPARGKQHSPGDYLVGWRISRRQAQRQKVLRVGTPAFRRRPGR